MPNRDREYEYFNRAGKAEWRCKYCPKTYLLSGGTAIISEHLNNRHGIKRDGAQDSRAKNQQKSIKEAMEQSGQHPHKRRKLHHREKGDSLDGGVLEILWVSVIAACSLTFRLVCLDPFRAFLHYLNPDIDVWLPTSPTTVSSWVIRQFQDRKGDMAQQIQSARSKIHISCDLWTSPNSLAILGIIAHFINENGKLQHCTLALKDIIGDHGGENLAKAMMEVLEEWGFVSKLGFFTMDNATNNDVMMRALQRGNLPISASNTTC